MRLDRYRLLLWLGMVLYTVVFTRLAFDLHMGMRTHRSDLGQIAQSIWNSSRGRFLENTDAGAIATRLTDHVEPILVLISPLLWVWDDVRALLLLQTVAVASGAWLLYQLTLRKLDQLLTADEVRQIWQVESLRQLTRPLALTLALAYLLAPQLQSAVLTEFHAAPLAVPLILWAFWAVETRRLAHVLIAVTLVASVKEEMALLAAGLGLWAWWRFWSLDFGFWIADAQSKIQNLNSKIIPLALLTLTALTWFYLTTFVIVPAHAVEVYGVAQSGYFARYGALGDSPLDILKSFFTQPGVVWQIVSEPARLAYLRNLLLPFGFFSLLAPEILLLALPVLLANLLSAYPAQYYGEFHYSAPLVPYVAVSAAYGLARLWRWIGRRAAHTSYSFQHLPAAGVGMMNLMAFWRNARTTLRPLRALVLGSWVIAWALTGYAAQGRGPLGGRYDPTPLTAHHRLLPRLVAQIPAHAAVTATAAVHPHVSHRRYVYQFPLGLAAPVPADWALLDVTTNTDMAPGDLKAQVDALLAGEWGVVDGADGFLLLAKGAGTKTIPAAFYDFARGQTDATLLAAPPASPAADWALDVAEDWPRWRQTELALGVWGVTGPVDLRSDLQFAVVTPSGATIDPLAITPPALVWHPLAAWQPGETVRVTTLPLHLPRLWALALTPPPTPYYNEGLLNSPDGAWTIGAIHYRETDDQLFPAVFRLLGNGELGRLAGWIEATPLTEASGRFRLLSGAEVQLHGWLPQWAQRGEAFYLWLQWNSGERWPHPWQPFVHLRAAGETQAQADGPLRFFIEYDVDGWLADHPVAPDLRAVTLPPDAPIGARWQVVLGLYDPQSGQRAAVLDEAGNELGNELLLGEIEIATARVPDQTCALIPATCASQTEP
jgi:uncharacterized membrane protein